MVADVRTVHDLLLGVTAGRLPFPRPSAEREMGGAVNENGTQPNQVPARTGGGAATCTAGVEDHTSRRSLVALGA
jgi:hypothetical protein